mgnify:CR=1 FL=1
MRFASQFVAVHERHQREDFKWTFERPHQSRDPSRRPSVRICEKGISAGHRPFKKEDLPVENLALHDPRHVPKSEGVAAAEDDDGHEADVRPRASAFAHVFHRPSLDEDEREPSQEHAGDHARDRAEEKASPARVVDEAEGDDGAEAGVVAYW